MPTNYSNGIIYKLCCKDANITDIYIGSTTSFRARKTQHKWCCNTPHDKSYNRLCYSTIRANGGFTNWDMVEIEKFDATDKRELLSRERYWIELLRPSMNKAIPGRTGAEWFQDNAEKRKEQMKQYRIDTDDRLKAKHTCDCGKIYTHSHIARHLRTTKHREYEQAQI
jgi:hypothetical protein